MQYLSIICICVYTYIINKLHLLTNTFDLFRKFHDFKQLYHIYIIYNLCDSTFRNRCEKHYNKVDHHG